MGKYILDANAEIDWMAVGPLIIFFVFFVVISIRAITASKTHINKMGSLPLDED